MRPEPRRSALGLGHAWGTKQGQQGTTAVPQQAIVLPDGELAIDLPNEDAPTPMNRVNKCLEGSSLPRT
jgi:hypothetical protein